MIIRIVKMTLKPDEIATFKAIFEQNKHKIRAFEGCTHLELLQEIDTPVLMTYSYWEKEEDLEHYRQSDLFASVWKQVKPLFNAKTEAWSVTQLVKL